MDRYARWNALLEMLTDNGRVSVEEAAERLDVSQATIRRDFDQLAQQQMITRTRGGAVANGVSYDLPLRYKTAKHSAEKQRIGAAAAALVTPGTVVGLNGGTTSTEVARALAVRPDLNTSAEGAQLTVVTNALNIANELLVRSRMKVVVAGGVVRPKSFELVGPLGGALLREVTLDVALLGVDAIDPQLGAAAHHEGEAAMNNLMVARAKRVVIIADSSKLGGHAFARICPIERVETLVTDSGAAPEVVDAFRAAGVRSSAPERSRSVDELARSARRCIPRIARSCIPRMVSAVTPTHRGRCSLPAVLEIEGLRKTYKSRRRGTRNALDGFDMRVEAGQVHGFLGPNGSGKTTTLRTLLGLIRPDGGRMALLGHEVPDALPTVAGQVGAIVESPQFFPHFTARDTLSLLAGAGERAGRPGRRGAGTRRAARPGRRAGQDVLVGHEAAARRRLGPAEEPAAADPRRAGQRPRPGRHPGDAHADAHPRRVRHDRGAVQPHPR